MKKVGIIGGGFSGTMTAVQLILSSDNPLHIVLIDRKSALCKGIAYSPYSRVQLLNVVTAKMSAFPDLPNHFLEWIMMKPRFAAKDEMVIANSFMPRYLYGEYIEEIWANTLKIAEQKNMSVTTVDAYVNSLVINGNEIALQLDNNEKLLVDYCVFATGNMLPGNVKIKNSAFFQSKNYYQNPWKKECVTNLKNDLPILIVGNGLTMVDTVLGLLENHFENVIFSLSPNGFNILPHRHNGLKYGKLVEELPADKSLYSIFALIHKHIKSVREFGVSAEPVIDSIRPYTQSIWRGFSEAEKKKFLSKLRHVWGVARHRIPLHIHDKLQQLRIDGKLKVIAGRVLDITEGHEGIIVEYIDKQENKHKSIKVSRIINCTGPESDYMYAGSELLKNALLQGIVAQDKLKLGLNTDVDTLAVKNSIGTYHANIFTIGSNVKGELWESTAVNELRSQAVVLAKEINKRIGVKSFQPPYVN